MRYWVQLATEQFPPSALVRQAVAADSAPEEALRVYGESVLPALRG